MERRVLIAIFLSFIVLYAYQAFVVKPAPKPVARRDAAREPQRPAAPGVRTEGGVDRRRGRSRAARRQPAAALVGDSTERDVRIETRDVIAIFTNRGARLKSWRLKKYLDQQRQPQELIENQLATQPLPFTLQHSDAQLDTTR